MNKILYFIFAVLALTACEKQTALEPDLPMNTEGIPFDPTLLYVKILDQNGSNIATGKTIGYEETQLVEFIDDANLFGSEYGFFLHKEENDVLRIVASCFGQWPTRNPTVTFSLRSQLLFLDEQKHSFKYRTELKLDTTSNAEHPHYHQAISLTFDGRTIEPDADGVFVIRLNDK